MNKLLHNKYGFVLSALLLAGTAAGQAPPWNWVKSAGSGGDDYSNAVCCDASGNVYVAGTFEGTVDFDPGPGTAYLTSAGFYDIFVAKYDAAGNFLWAGALGDIQGFGEAFGIAADASGSGDVVVTGYYWGTMDFDPGPGVFTLLSDSGTIDVFMVRLNSAGGLVWAKSVGGDWGDDFGTAVSVDASGNIYLAGFFTDTVDFDPGPGTLPVISASPGWEDAFLAKYNAAGNVIWAKAVGGPDYDEANGLCTGSAGEVYLTGSFEGTADFDPGPAVQALVSAGNTDMFLCRFDSAGNLVWVTGAGDVDYESGTGVWVAPNGDVLTTGFFGDVVDFDPGGGTAYLSSAGFSDIFVWRLTNSGNLVFARSMGGAGNDEAYAITTDAAGHILTFGNFWDAADFDPGPGTFTLTPSSQFYSDVFLSCLDASGNFSWAVKADGAGGNEYGEAIAADAAGNVVVCGFYFSPTLLFGPVALVNADNTGATGDFFLAQMHAASTGLTYPQALLSCSVFPQPANDMLRIRLESNAAMPAHVELADLTGRIVIRRQVIHAKDIALDVAGLTDGIYLLNIRCGSETGLLKVAVAH